MSSVSLDCQEGQAKELEEFVSPLKVGSETLFGETPELRGVEESVCGYGAETSKVQ